MKQLFYVLLITSLIFLSACSDDDDNKNVEEYTTYRVDIQLANTEENSIESFEGIKVQLIDSRETKHDATANASGLVTFKVPAGIYRATASHTIKVDVHSKIYDWALTNLIVTSQWDEAVVSEMKLTESEAGSIIIKELYVGGCPKDDGSGYFHYDKYVILYNNSNQQAKLENLCLGIVQPYNADGTNKDMIEGHLIYENKDWIPAGTGIWYYPGTLVLEPGKQAVIALNNATINTKTYSQSVDFNAPEYYCTYDLTAYANEMYYPAPDASIPTNHYWAGIHYGKGNGWSLSNSSPAFFIFQTQGVTPREFVNNKENENYYGNSETDTNRRMKVPVSWILDGIEVFTSASDKNQKRLTPKVDAGQTVLTNKMGYSSYRNVDKSATEAIKENEGKLVYDYNKGTTTTDPSGIDAESSIKKGAIIIYQDTNNSSNDFHQRSQASLRDR